MTFVARPRVILWAALFACVVPPTDGFSQTLLGIGTGVVYGGDVSEAPNETLVATAGYWGTSPFGFEVEFGWYPGFFPSTHPDPAHHVTGDLTTAAGHVIVGAPVGGRRGFGIRPFLSGGLVLFSVEVEEPNGLFQVQSRDVGFDVGAGLIVFAGDHVGIRTDVRYYRSGRDTVQTERLHPPDCCTPIGFTTFGFRRATLSLTARF